MKRFNMSAVFLISLLVFTAGYTFAICPDCKDGQPCPKCAKMEEKRFDKMAKELNLTDTQKQQVKTHKEKHWTAMKDIFKQLKEKREALLQELQKPDSDKTKIDALKNDLKELNAKRIDAMVEAVSEMKQILTPEQRKIMNENIKKRHEKMKGSADKKGWRGMDAPPEGDMDDDRPQLPEK